MPRLGRPAKYNELIKALEPNKIHSPGSIVRNAMEKKIGPFSEELSDEERKKMVTRIRHAFARRCANHQFPKGGDGLVDLPGQAPAPGWTTERWLETIRYVKGAR